MTAVLKIYYSVQEFHRMFNGCCLLGDGQGVKFCETGYSLQGFSVPLIC